MIIYKALIEALTKDHLIISGLDVTDVINIYNNPNFIAVLSGRKGFIVPVQWSVCLHCICMH